MVSQRDSVMSEFQRIQDIIQRTYHRIDVLEKKLAQQTVTDDKESLEKELNEAKDILKNSERRLLKLRKDNSRTFMVAACLVFAIFLIYCLYCVVFNPY